MFRNIFRTLLDTTFDEIKKEFSNQYILRLKPKLKLLIVGNTCRTPSGSVPSFLQVLDEVLEMIQLHSCELVIMGNFNLNLCDQRSSSSLDFLSTMLFCGTLPSACIPTCITNTTASLILFFLCMIFLIRCLGGAKELVFPL